MKDLEKKHLDSAATKMNYNLEALDSELLKYSTAACGLLICLNGAQARFFVPISLLLLLIVSKVVSYKISAISQENYISFISSKDKSVAERLKFFNRYKRTNAFAEYLNNVSLTSFILACLCIFLIL